MRMRLIKWLLVVPPSLAVCRASGDAEPPKNYAVALYNSFDAVDVYGPLDILFYLSFSHTLKLDLIAETMDPVWMRPAAPGLNKAGSNFTASFNPTHTYASPPKDIEVLLVPGGAGMRYGNGSAAAVDFIRETYPKLKYLVTICTGSGVAAKAGVLDGKRATTNKSAWNETVKLGPNVRWVSPARWTVDGNIWTSSGVTSGFDLIFEFIDRVYGEDVSRKIQGSVEYVRASDPCDDPFAAWYNIPPSGDCRQSDPE
ncbi:ThiJ/PfpI family protein [Metarhizium rileyi]|uniref:ThiJ/PfpI family protein n=1 Tax=Metarhizium rileyi (strain RCEF 4871) TaxID=1649241 RepID=A0A167E0U9_METRR|nr:ThiJ/PfpI family protein [Metarhizium rileyi RCEF 4871]